MDQSKLRMSEMNVAGDGKIFITTSTYDAHVTSCPPSIEHVAEDESGSVTPHLHEILQDLDIDQVVRYINGHRVLEDFKSLLRFGNFVAEGLDPGVICDKWNPPTDSQGVSSSATYVNPDDAYATQTLKLTLLLPLLLLLVHSRCGFI